MSTPKSNGGFFPLNRLAPGFSELQPVRLPQVSRNVPLPPRSPGVKSGRDPKKPKTPKGVPAFLLWENLCFLLGKMWM